MDYTIYFENVSNATAAAQEIRVTLPKDAGLDWSTLELGEIAFGDNLDSGLAGKASGESTYAPSESTSQVKSAVTSDSESVVWYLRSWDPNTTDHFPANAADGFLPPNDAETHCGEGHVRFRVKVSDDAVKGSVINASATIVFDQNDPIETDPAWWNTVTPETIEASFATNAVAVCEGSNIVVTVFGGSAYREASLQLYLNYQTAAAADIDLKMAKVDGVTPKGGVKFPLTLSWAADEIGTKTISIPVKTDKTVEDDETLVFQLAAAQGQELGEVATCAVTIRDANVAADYAAKQAKETVKTKKGVATNALAVACCANDGSGAVCGYTTGQGQYAKGSKASLKATARPGWEFKGWGEVVRGGQGLTALPDGVVTNILSEKASWSVTLTNDAEIVALFGRIPYVTGLATPADGGKVAGSGYCAAGKKVTLKATANKNFTFTGWVVNAVGDGTPTLPIMTPTLVFDRSAKPAKSDAKQTVITNVSESVTYYATFKSDPEIFVTAACDDAKGAELTGKGAGKFVAGTVTGAGKYAAGKKVTLKATANKGYVFAGWWEGAVGAGGGEGLAALPDGEPVSSLSSLVLSEMPTNDVELTAMFITSGLDKSNIVATVNGMAFETTVGGGTPTLPTNVWAGVYLEWPIAASALSETTVKVAGLPSGLKFTATPVTTKVTTGSGKAKVTTVVTNVAANTIYGAPTAASKTKTDRKTGVTTVTPSAVKVTVTTAGKSSQTYQIDTTVDPLPGWAVGTFTGPSYDRGRDCLNRVGDGMDSSSSDAIATIASTSAGDGASTNGTVSVTIGANGKISAKQPVNGKSTSFAASYFDGYAETDDPGLVFHATLTAKVGSEIVTNEMAVCGHAGRVTLPTGDEQTVTNGVIEADRFDAWQYNWKVEPWKGIAKALVASYPKATTTYAVLSDGAVLDGAAGAEAVLGAAFDPMWLDPEDPNPYDDPETAPFVSAKVSLKFAASGAVSVAGEFASLDADGQPVRAKSGKLVTVKASASSTLVPEGSDGGLVFVYLAPKGLPAHVRCVKVPWPNLEW